MSTEVTLSADYWPCQDKELKLVRVCLQIITDAQLYFTRISDRCIEIKYVVSKYKPMYYHLHSCIYVTRVIQLDHLGKVR